MSDMYLNVIKEKDTTIRILKTEIGMLVQENDVLRMGLKRLTIKASQLEANMTLIEKEMEKDVPESARGAGI